MEFGIVLPIDQAHVAQSAGFDYLEEDLTRLLSPHLPDDQWHAPIRSIPPVLAVHGLIPQSMPITGPTVNLTALRLHVQRACERAGQMGIRLISLSSPGALHIPNGFDPKQAKSQILDFLRTAVPFFARYELMLVAGVNSPADCDVMTTLPEVMQYVWAVDHPWFQCVLDIGCIRDEQTTIEQVKDALPWIRHVNVRPQVGNESRPILDTLHGYQYDDFVTVGCGEENAARDIPLATLERLKKWNSKPAPPSNHPDHPGFSNTQ